MARKTKAKRANKSEGATQGGNGRDRLIEAAVRLFGRHGFKAVSVRAIAKDAGVSWALIRFYFGSKEGLRKAAEKQIMATYLKLTEELSASESIDQVADVFDHAERAWALSDAIRYLPRALIENRPFVLEILRSLLNRTENPAAVALREEYPGEDILRDPVYALVPVMGHYLLAPQIKKLLGRDVFDVAELKRRNLQIGRIWELIVLGLEAEKKSRQRR